MRCCCALIVLLVMTGTAEGVSSTAYWRFEEASGTTVLDSGPNALDGTLNGLPFRTVDVPVDPVPLNEFLNTQSLDLNWQNTSSGGRFRVEDATGLLNAGGESFTFEAWVKLSEVSDASGGGQRQYLCQKKPDSGPDSDLDYAFLAQAGDLGATGRELAMRYGDGVSQFTQLSTLEIADMDWHHVSLAYDAATGELRFGVDGVFDTIPFVKPSFTVGGPLRVGAHQNTAGTQNQFLRGAIDEVRFVSGFVPVDLLLDVPGADCNTNGIPDVIDIADGTSLDCNGNCVPDECDISSGTSDDCQSDGIPDDCQFEEFRYAWDDGEGDALVQATGTHMAWLSSFTVAGGFSTITHLDAAFREEYAGRAATAYLWSDPNGDGDPTDATVLVAHPFTIASDVIDLNENTLVDIPDTFVGPAGTSFFAGITIDPDGEVGDPGFPARYDFGDQPGVPGVSWVIGANGPIDPNDLSNGAVEFALVELAGLPPGNWVLQAVVEGSDCNGNGVPDDCDIDGGTSDDCNGNGIPDECEVDCNLNGVPDDCDIDNGTSDDLDMDGVPDECPLAAICVPVDVSTIQGAIDVGGDGTVVTVKDGTYFETLDFDGKAITVVSENGPATTTIDGGGAGSVVSFRSGEGGGAVLEGLTVTGGTGTSGAGGGAIIVQASSPTIRGNVIIGNATDDFGGGILVFGSSSPTIVGNHIEGNHGGAAGGGIYVEVDNDFVRIRDNAIIGNTVNNGPGGGLCFANGTVEFVGNEVADNTGADSGGGLFVILSGAAPSVIASNEFRDNQATEDGGGMWIDTANPLVVNNLFVGNSAPVAAGVLADNVGTFANNTVVGNVASSSAGGFFDEDGTFAIVNSIIRGNTAPASPQIGDPTGTTTATWSNVEGGWPGIGNIDADPLFVDPGAGNYQLGFGSPCIDAGSNLLVPADAADLDDDGNVAERTPLDLLLGNRFADDVNTADTGVADPPDYVRVVDMGALEAGCAADITGPDGPDGNVDALDFLLLIGQWGTPCVGTCEGDITGPAGVPDGNVDALDFLILIAQWGSPGGCPQP
jgi:hypothetical protein